MGRNHKAVSRKKKKEAKDERTHSQSHTGFELTSLQQSRESRQACNQTESCSSEGSK